MKRAEDTTTESTVESTAKSTSKKFTLKTWLTIVGFIAALVIGYLYRHDLYRIFGDQETIESTVEAWGALGPLIFILLNAAQVVIAPLPGVLIGVVGGYLFGVWFGFLLNIAGVLIGSLIAFYLARWFGKPIVDKFVGPRTAAALGKVAETSGIIGLTIVYLIPFVPDDALCFVAGLTAIRTRVFVAIVIFARSPASLVATMTGAGLINFSLATWTVIAAISIIGFIIFWRHRSAVEAWVSRYLLRGSTNAGE